MAAVGAIPSGRKPVPTEFPPVEDKESTLDGDMRGINRARVQERHQSRMKRMAEYFAEQPKETIKVRKEFGDQRVQINSYPFYIQAGVKVRVPTDVAEALRNAEII